MTLLCYGILEVITPIPHFLPRSSVTVQQQYTPQHLRDLQFSTLIKVLKTSKVLYHIIATKIFTFQHSAQLLNILRFQHFGTKVLRLKVLNCVTFFK